MGKRSSSRWIGLVVFLALFFSFPRVAANEFLLEGRASYFIPSDQNFRQTYHNGWMYGIEGAYQLKSNFYGWISGDYFHKNLPRASIALVPLGLGLKLMTHNRFINVYGQAGGLASYLHTRGKGTLSLCNPKWWVGGILKGGFLLDIKRFLLVDLFADYSFVDLPVHKSECRSRTFRNLDGWSVGVGLVLSFGKVASSKRHSTKRYEEPPPPGPLPNEETIKVIVPKRYRPA